MKTNANFVGGAWVEPHASDDIDLINPANEEVYGSIPESTAHDVDAVSYTHLTLPTSDLV